MSLTGKVAQAPTGAHGFDCNDVVTQSVAKALCQAGFQFCIRYISRFSPQGGGDLTAAEATAILRGGLALMAVQHVAKAGWVANASLGTQYGKAAVANARSVGLPDGVNVWLDLEGIRQGVSSSDVIEYCNAWFHEVDSAAYASGVYVGARCILSGDELFWRLKTRHYWRSGSHVPDIPQRGYQMAQYISPTPDIVSGVSIDRDLTMTDKLGGSVTWIEP